MPRLFSYTIPHDDGAAPNPFHGLCTLAICKPSIRRVAAVGDWVAGLGSINAAGDVGGKLVYAMRVDEILTLAEYDFKAPTNWPRKIPDITSLDFAERLGDCIYDYSGGPKPIQRLGVHNEGNRDIDLGGEKVLLSDHFFYFGRDAIALDPGLQGIIHQTQGHKSNANDHLVDSFIKWVDNLGYEPGQHGWPGKVLPKDFWTCGGGCLPRRDDCENSSIC